MQPTTPATFRPDEHLAQHLLTHGFIETTSNAYHRARGWRSFYHTKRWLSVWLQPGSITVQAGPHWRFEAQGQVAAETLEFLLAAQVAAPPADG
jgi:hypothetical protein